MVASIIILELRIVMASNSGPNWASLAEKAKSDFDTFASGRAPNGERIMTEADLMQVLGCEGTSSLSDGDGINLEIRVPRWLLI